MDRLTLEVAQGEVFGLVGPDGAGKTTTLRMLCGLMDPTRGLGRRSGPRCEERSAGGEGPDRVHGAAVRPVSAISRVEENMDFYADLFGVSARDSAADDAAAARHDAHGAFRDRHAGELSGGMKQKLALMCTLLHRPEILFLDEPTNGVDPVSRRDFWAILYDLVKDGMTVFVTTAYLDEAERCNRVGLMDRGKLIQCDTPAGLKETSA